jgi:hypothetical protein
LDCLAAPVQAGAVFVSLKILASNFRFCPDKSMSDDQKTVAELRDEISQLKKELQWAIQPVGELSSRSYANSPRTPASQRPRFKPLSTAIVRRTVCRWSWATGFSNVFTNGSPT